MRLFDPSNHFEPYFRHVNGTLDLRYILPTSQKWLEIYRFCTWQLATRSSHRRFGADLPGVFDNSRLSDDAHLDLARILEFFFYLVGDITRKFAGFEVGYRFRFYDDADLATGGDGIAFLNARLAVRYRLQFLKAFDVVLNGITPCTRAAAGDGVGHLHDHALGSLVRVFFVVRLHCLYHRLINAELLENTPAYLHVRAGHFVVYRFADIVEKGSGARGRLVGAELSGKHSCQMSDLH